MAYIPTGNPRGRPRKFRGPDISYGKQSPDFIPRKAAPDGDTALTPEAWEDSNEVSAREVSHYVGFDTSRRSAE